MAWDGVGRRGKEWAGVGGSGRAGEGVGWRGSGRGQVATLLPRAALLLLARLASSEKARPKSLPPPSPLPRPTPD